MTVSSDKPSYSTTSMHEALETIKRVEQEFYDRGKPLSTSSVSDALFSKVHRLADDSKMTLMKRRAQLETQNLARSQKAR
jgi:hypothetical protein